MFFFKRKNEAINDEQKASSLAEYYKAEADRQAELIGILQAKVPARGPDGRFVAR